MVLIADYRKPETSTCSLDARQVQQKIDQPLFLLGNDVENIGHEKCLFNLLKLSRGK